MSPVRSNAVLFVTMSAMSALLVGCGGGSSDDAGSRDSSAAAAPSTSSPSSPGSTSSPSSSDGTASSASSATVGPTSTATGSDFAALSGQEIADTSKAAMLTLTSVRYQGNVASSDGSGTITLNLQADSGGDCTGQLGIQGGRVTLLAVGGQGYFKGDRKFWQAAAGTAADSIIKGINGRWVLDSNQDFSQFCSLNGFLTNLFATVEGTTYAVQGTSTLAGQDVVTVDRTSTEESASSTGYVLTGAQHYLLRIERTSGDQKGRLDFSNFNDPVTVQAPAADDIVDPSTLGSSAAPSSSAG